MKPSSRRTASGKTLRVATTFTGAAACAVAFAPAATAGTHPRTAQTGHRVLMMGPDTVVVKNHCPAGTSDWLHLAYIGVGTGDICFGYSGSHYFGSDPFSIRSFCGGNNTGKIWGYNSQGREQSIPFGHGDTYAKVPGGNNFLVTRVSLFGWGGTDHCGPPPNN